MKEDETAEDPTKQKVEQELEEIETMFVQTAGEAVEGHVLTLDDVSRSTLYFSDRPERVVGHVRSEMLVELWDAGANSSRRERAQCGALVPGTRRQGPGGRRDGDPESSHQRAVPLLRHEVLEGTMPAHAKGGLTLFIDPFGRPLSLFGPGASIAVAVAACDEGSCREPSICVSIGIELDREAPGSIERFRGKADLQRLPCRTKMNDH